MNPFQLGAASQSSDLKVFCIMALTNQLLWGIIAVLFGRALYRGVEQFGSSSGS